MNSQGAFHGNGEDDQRQSANTKQPLPSPARHPRRNRPSRLRQTAIQHPQLLTRRPSGSYIGSRCMVAGVRSIATTSS